MVTWARMVTSAAPATTRTASITRVRGTTRSARTRWRAGGARVVMGFLVRRRSSEAGGAGSRGMAGHSLRLDYRAGPLGPLSPPSTILRQPLAQSFPRKGPFAVLAVHDLEIRVGARLLMEDVSFRVD